MDDAKERKGATVLEPDLAGPPPRENSQISPKSMLPDEDVVSRRPDVDTRKYELVDDGQHWTLITKLDPKTEQSIRFAFDEALSRQ